MENSELRRNVSTQMDNCKRLLQEYTLKICWGVTHPQTSATIRKDRPFLNMKTSDRKTAMIGIGAGINSLIKTTTDQYKINQLQLFCKANRQPQNLIA